MNIAKRAFPLKKVYTLIEPGPVVMISTALKGRPNIMTMSWHTMIDFVPPLLGLVISNRNYTFDILKATGECVVNIPAAALAKKAVACGNVSGRTVDKFKAFGLTPVKASRVKAPLIGECFVNLECKVVDPRMADLYDLFIVEVVRAWIDPRQKNARTLHHRGKDVFWVSGKTVKIPNRMK
ncbi:MAG: flavin reductase family protein [Candidatus Omnitrophota bacterium]